MPYTPSTDAESAFTLLADNLADVPTGAPGSTTESAPWTALQAGTAVGGGYPQKAMFDAAFDTIVTLPVFAGVYTANTNVTPNMQSVYLLNSAGGGFQVNLTTSAANAGKWVWIKKTSADGNTITVVPTAGLIDGAANKTFTAQYTAITVICDGSNWWIF